MNRKSQEDSAIDILRRKLEHLRVAEAKNADPLREFELREAIRSTQARIAELESDSVPLTCKSQVADDLRKLREETKFRHSKLTGILQDCLENLNEPLPIAEPHRTDEENEETAYTKAFEKLQAAIELGDEVFDEAAEYISHGKNAAYEVALDWPKLRSPASDCAI